MEEDRCQEDQRQIEYGWRHDEEQCRSEKITEMKRQGPEKIHVVEMMSVAKQKEQHRHDNQARNGRDGWSQNASDR
jgi:hypothetical protein